MFGRSPTAQSALDLLTQPKGAFSIAYLLASFCSPVTAYTLNELDPFSFGKLAITRNDLTYNATLSRSGSYNLPPQIMMIEIGQPGRFLLSGYPQSTPLTFSVPITPLHATDGSVGPELLFSQVSQQSPINTDQKGELLFSLGATLATNGNGTAYPDGTYAGNAFLRVEFPTQTGSSFFEHAINIQVELKSSITLREETGLNFGTIAAWPSATDSASMSISPTGSVIVSNPGMSRIHYLTGASPAVFKISSGAPGAKINITLPAEANMTLEASGPSAAQFRVTDFNTFPLQNNLYLNGQGNLELKLGAVLRTELSNNSYLDGEYSGSYTINLNY